ncbi:MAG: class I SAM-dependent methyltransferase [Solirubrobacteraceae bacterium]
MYYRDFLGRIHEVLEPPTYLEIGVRNGDSLALARSPAIGIDPAYRLHVAPPPGAKLFPVTSDDFFERAEPLLTFGGRRVGFSFIDGMHLSEFALRDFANVERHADWTAAIVFDDILPRDIPEANRDRTTHQWTGDVYKLLEVLEEHRPDLIVLRVGTEPTGLGLVLGLDPDSGVLEERLDAITDQIVQPDPQPVPEAVLARHGALEPDTVLAASFWSVLRDLRERGVSRDEGLPPLRAAIERDFGGRG